MSSNRHSNSFILDAEPSLTRPLLLLGHPTTPKPVAVLMALADKAGGDDRGTLAVDGLTASTPGTTPSKSEANAYVADMMLS